MSYLKNFRIATSGIGSTTSNVIMGDIPTLEQYTSQVPTIRITCFGCAGNETTSMGIWTMIRYALDRYPDIRTYPAYFNADNTQVLNTNHEALHYFAEIKNNANLIGELKESDELTLEIQLSGIMVKQSPKVIILKAKNLTELLEQLPETIQKLVSLLAERTAQQQLSILYVKSSNVAYIEGVWELEKLLIESLISDDWNEGEFLTVVENAIAQVASAESDLIVETIFDIARTAIFPPYDLTAEVRKQLLDAIMGSHNEVAAAFLFASLNQHGAAQVAVQLMDQSKTEFGNSVKGRFAEALLLTNDTSKAIQVYQDVLRQDSQNSSLLVSYAATLAHASKLEKMPDDFTSLLVKDGTAIDEILHTYQKAYGIEGEVEYLLFAFECAFEHQDERSANIFNQLAGVDKAGLHIALAIAALQDDELIETIEYVEEQVGEETTGFRLLALVELYLAVDDLEAAKECLNDYLNSGGEQDTRTRLLGLRLNFPQLEFQVSQFHQMNEEKVTLKDSEIDTIEEGIALHPYFTDGYLVLAKAYANRNDSEAGIEVLREAITIVRDDPRLFLVLGQLLWTNEKHEEALNTWLVGNKQFPYDVSLIVWIARSLFDDGAEDEAKLYLQQAEMISPTSRELAGMRNYIGRKLSSD